MSSGFLTFSIINFLVAVTGLCGFMVLSVSRLNFGEFVGYMLIALAIGIVPFVLSLAPSWLIWSLLAPGDGMGVSLFRAGLQGLLTPSIILIVGAAALFIPLPENTLTLLFVQSIFGAAVLMASGPFVALALALVQRSIAGAS